jgi:tetratricopeptide (TPR) repeat protein
LPAARRVAERLIWSRPDDARALTLLGRIWLAWPVFGRWQADSLLTRAAALNPDNPEPFYYLGLVGIALGGDDGEWVARRGLTRVLALEPTYRDAWALWTRLYRGPSERRAAVAALARHAGEPAPDLWRSQLLIELKAYDEARPLLDALLARSPGSPAPNAHLAQLLYETGRDAEAAPVYETALAHADADTGGVLWRQVRSTASPGERGGYDRTPPQGRAAFFRRFWAYRTPDLRATLNGRIGEHFRRLRDARRVYALQHPNSRYFRSPVLRSFPRFGQGAPGCLLAAIGPGSRVTLPRAPRVAPANADETLNLEDGLDDRGRIFVRYGAPDERVACEVGSETWRYRLRQGVLQISFARRTGPDGGGDALVTPLVPGEWEAAQWLLATDRASAPETLDFAFWTASFRGATRWQTDVLVFPDYSVAATAALLDANGRTAARDSAAGAPLRLRAAPGRYLLALDAERGDRRGRYRSGFVLPRFAGDSLAVSGLLVTDRDAPGQREAMVAAAPSRLRLAAGRPLRFYAEVYGLASRDGVSRYDAAYVFERLGGRGVLGLRGVPLPTSFAFQREQPVRRITVESLVIDPGRLPPGRYRLRLEVRDAVADERAASATLEFELR